MGRFPTIPDHELLQPIAAGAYGEVWLARNAVGTPRAVKIVRRDRHGSAESFEREFRGLQKFEPVSRTHDGFVDILTLGLLPDGAGFYYVMELADGADDGGRTTEDGSSGAEAGCQKREASGQRPETGAQGGGAGADVPPGSNSYIPRTLRQELRKRGRLAVAECVELGLALTRALAHLHAQGLVHRDVKPSNIIYVGGVPKLADVGLVTEAVRGDDARSIVGTEGYLPTDGLGTPRADLYALGKVLYEAVTGQDRREFPALPGGVAGWPERRALLELNELLLKCCAMDPGASYASAAAVAEDLERLQRGNSLRWRHAGERGLRWARRVWPVAAVLAVALGWAVFRPTRVPPGSDASGRSTLPAWRVDKAWSAELYRRARAVTILRKERYGQAKVLFNEAIDYDPAYAPSYSGLANVYVQINDWLEPPRAALSDARKYAAKALELDPIDREALVVMGCVKADLERDWAGAEAQFKRALELHPDYARATFYYAVLLRNMGRLVEARVVTDRGLARNPGQPLLQWGALYQSCDERQYERAIREAHAFSAGDTNRWGSTERVVCGWAALQLGRYEAAIESFKIARQQSEHTWSMACQAWACARAGRTAEAAELVGNIERLARVMHVSNGDLARAHWALGNRGKALDHLERAVAESAGLVMFGNLLTDPLWDELRADPRFQAVVKALRLPGPAAVREEARPPNSADDRRTR